MEDWEQRLLISDLTSHFADSDYVEKRFKLRLSAVTINPTYPLILLHRIAEPSIHEDVREATHIKLNKFLKTHWNPSSVLTGTIRKDIRQQIKVLLVPLLVTENPKIQALVIESINIIGKGFNLYTEWPALLPELSSRLELAINANDYATVVAILHSVNSLFFDKCTRYYHHWNRCLENFAESLLRTVESISSKINDTLSVEVLRLLVEAQRVSCRIFDSFKHFNYIFWVFPEGFVFEDYMDKWMNEFKKFLTVKYQGVEDSSIDELRVAVCHILCSRCDHNVKLFEKYASGFVDVVCSMLLIEERKSDQLIAAAIRFLTCVGKSKLHHALFSRNKMLQKITDGIIFPNMMLRGEDEELFVTNYVEFINRSDMLSSLERRRFVACYFFENALYHKENIIDQKVKSHIVSCLALFDENPTANWRYKECAIYLVDSLGNKVADVESIFRLYIVPELESQDVNAFPMLKAASLKFLTKYQCVIPKHLVMAHLDNLVRFLTSDFNAVHSYAADCIYKLLLVKGDGLERYHIWASLFNHLQNCRPPSRLVICLVIFMSRFLVKDGVQNLVDSINSVQAIFFDDFLAEFWIPNVKSITGDYIDVKVSVVASIKLLCESPLLLDPAAEVLWGKLLDGIVTLLSQLEDKPEFQIQDPLKEIKDPKRFLLTSLASLSSQFRGRFPPIIIRYLSTANQATLLQLCNSYNLRIV